MDKIQTIRITKSEFERLSENFLMRALRIFALQEDLMKFAVTAVFLSDFGRTRVYDFLLKGPDGFKEINSQAKEGRGLFAAAGRPTEQEQEFEKIINQRIEKGDWVDDIVFEMGKELSVSEIEELILACINGKHFDIAREAVNNFPFTKRTQVITILS